MKTFLFSIIVSFALFLGACGTVEEEQTAEENDNGADVTEEEPETEDNHEEEDTEKDAEKDEESKEEEGSETDLASGIEEVQSNLDSLNKTVENASDNLENIHAEGEELEENWDVIEDQVGEKYPDDYTNIEKSLYPLIDEAKGEEPGTDTIQELIKETQDKLEEFLTKVEKE
ncbi:hypothetical protein [Alteribacillus bidgolensis]|uniref:Uncharacterized protein n=1 Tax=Alteribacillus bidgolensis TaxID=930129 RepID=A0A1G8J9F6_9BACI|nr:hypothetical protein [Alteribacillus bidgolensis]SDI27826.1 hypothetical protein SAMN05216352_106108 [Alteribacillus bidgolensis]